MKRFKIIYFSIFAGLCVLILLLGKTLNPVVVVGESMEPTYYDGDILISKSRFTQADITQGTIICFEESGKTLIKRVVAIPGDTLRACDGTLYINEEAWLTDETITDFGIFTLGEDEYYVLGDNTSNSKDSRVFGPVLYSDITNIITKKIL